MIKRISATGPITIADYMAECLWHPDFGYYATKNPLGAEGDFTTSPEITQMFGELIGLCLAQCWLDHGSPKDISLVELGPGRGSLMADALRATSGIPGFHAAVSVCFVEASPTLRKMQKDTVPTAEFFDTVDGLPEQPTYIIANEFFDALPIRQFRRADDGWSERMVGVEDNQLVVGLSAAAPLALLDHRLKDTQPGDLVEVCQSLPAIIESISTRIAEFGGAGLIIDYGDWTSLGDTFQAMEAHGIVDPFASPGQSDLTAHVDFAEIAKAAQCETTRLTTQGVFLERLGITARAQALASTMAGEDLENHIAAHRRLTHPAEMGNLFKVMGLYPTGQAAPPGLET